MKNNKGKYRVVLIILAVLVMVGILAIWVQSMLPKEISDIESNYVYKLVKTPLKAIFAHTYVGTTFMRKFAHKVEYAFIGSIITLALLFWLLYKNKNKRIKIVNFFIVVALTIVICTAIGTIDELIQFFNDRAAMVSDVAMDVISGSIASTAVSTFFALIYYIRLVYKNKKQI